MVQAEFDKQAEITKLLLEGIQTAHVNTCFLWLNRYQEIGYHVVLHITNVSIG